MGKILFKPEESTSDFGGNRTQQRQAGFLTDRDLLRKRSAKYTEMFSSLDSKTLAGVQGWNELMQHVHEEFGTAELASLPLGIVSRCFLGAPYEVHILDMSGAQIIQHYKISERMPDRFEQARTLALHDAYALVEVYSDKLMLIRADGSATKV